MKTFTQSSITASIFLAITIAGCASNSPRSSNAKDMENALKSMLHTNVKIKYPDKYNGETVQWADLDFMGKSVTQEFFSFIDTSGDSNGVDIDEVLSAQVQLERSATNGWDIASIISSKTFKRVDLPTSSTSTSSTSTSSTYSPSTSSTYTSSPVYSSPTPTYTYTPPVRDYTPSPIQMYRERTNEINDLYRR